MRLSRTTPSEKYFQDAYRFEKLFNPEQPLIERIGLQGDAVNVAICTENDMIDEDTELFNQTLSKDDELISERLFVLARILREMGC